MNLSRFFAALGVFEELFIHAFLYLMGNPLGIVFRFHNISITERKFKASGSKMKEGSNTQIFSYILLSVLIFILLSSVTFATHNPGVSHSASSVMNGTFRDNYPNSEVRI